MPPRCRRPSHDARDRGNVRTSRGTSKRRPDALRPPPDDVGSSPDDVGSSPDDVGSSPDAVGTSPDAVGTSPDAVGTSPDGVGPVWTRHNQPKSRDISTIDRARKNPRNGRRGPADVGGVGRMSRFDEQVGESWLVVRFRLRRPLRLLPLPPRNPRRPRPRRGSPPPRTRPRRRRPSCLRPSSSRPPARTAVRSTSWRASRRASTPA